mgnify:FL=1
MTVVQYGKITDFKYLIADNSTSGYDVHDAAALSLDDLDDTDHMSFSSPVSNPLNNTDQESSQGHQAPPRRGGAPDLSDLDETY